VLFLSLELTQIPPLPSEVMATTSLPLFVGQVVVICLCIFAGEEEGGGGGIVEPVLTRAKNLRFSFLVRLL
jgi:hypothetical protein